MDDRELEGRLRIRLHGRFDDAPVPGGLVGAIRQGMATQTRPVGWFLRTRSLQLGWALGTAVAFVAIALAVTNLPKPPAQGTNQPSPSPAATVQPTASKEPDLVFFVIPSPTGDAGRDLANRVSDQLAARVMGLGAPTLGSSVNSFIVYSVPVFDGPTTDEIKDVLSVTGDIQFVPLPASDYGTGRFEAVPGKPLPKAEVPLFGWEGIASAARRGDVFEPNAVVTLNGAAADAFAGWTTNNVGGQFAIVVDGIVGVALQINVPITGGEVELASGLENATLFRRTVAILVAGKLADGWSNPTVIQGLSREDSILAAQHLHPTGAVMSSDADVLADGPFPRAVWRIRFSDGAVVTIDAVTAEWLSTGIG